MGEKRKGNPNWEPVYKNGSVVGYKKKRFYSGEPIKGGGAELTSSTSDNNSVYRSMVAHSDVELEKLRERADKTGINGEAQSVLKQLHSDAMLGGRNIDTILNNYSSQHDDSDGNAIVSNFATSCHSVATVSQWANNYFDRAADAEIEVQRRIGKTPGVMFRVKDNTIGAMGSWHGVYEREGTRDLVLESTPFSVSDGAGEEDGLSATQGVFSVGKQEKAMSALLVALEDDYEAMAEIYYPPEFI